MKKFYLAIALASTVLAAGALASCGNQTKEIAIVTDVGLLMDGGFNQGTYEGAKAYAEAHGKSYQYYQPQNGNDATNADREAAMRLAIKNGAKIIVAPGFLQQAAMEVVATENPDVKFVFVDGWKFGKSNVTAITYKEEESGYLAGYAVVKDGYEKLGGTFGGAGGNPACNRFCYGYLQGAAAAAADMGKEVSATVSFLHGASFSASPELQTQISGWYNAGTEIVFSCGGSMVNSVISARNAAGKGKIIGVDVDQASLSEHVVTSAVKGLAVSVEKVLGQFYDGKWDDELADVAQNLGASENATGLPTAEGSWRFNSFTKSEYDTLYAEIKSGARVIHNEIPSMEALKNNAQALSNITVTFEE